jgi:4,5-DOPA dioxygenase extradiol
MPEAGFDWARRFDDAARLQLRDNPGDLGKLREHPDFALAVPTPEHFLPLAYLAGIAARCGSEPNVLVEGYAMGSLSMSAYGIEAAASPTAPSSSIGRQQH